MTRLILTVVFAGLILSACVSSPYPPTSGQQSLGKLTLFQPLMFQPNKATVYVQQGKVVDRLDERDPSCLFTHWTVDPQPRNVAIDTFRVAEKTKRSGDVGQGFGVYGSTDLGFGVGFGLGGGNASIGQPGLLGGDAMGRFGDGRRQAQAATILRLVSSSQPMLYQLTCFSATAWSAFVTAPSESDINAILGNVAQVSLQK